MKKLILFLVVLSLVSISMVSASLSMNYTRLSIVNDFETCGGLDWNALSRFNYICNSLVPQENRTFFTADETILGTCFASNSSLSNITYNYAWIIDGSEYSTGTYGPTQQGLFTNVANLSLTNLFGSKVIFRCSATNDIETTPDLLSGEANITNAMINTTWSSTNNQDNQIGSGLRNSAIYVSYGNSNDSNKGYFSICPLDNLSCTQKKFTDDATISTDMTFLKDGRIAVVYKKFGVGEVYLMICDTNGDNCVQTQNNTNAINSDSVYQMGQRVVELNNTQRNIVYTFKSANNINDANWYVCDNNGTNCNYFNQNVNPYCAYDGDEAIALREGQFMHARYGCHFWRSVFTWANTTQSFGSSPFDSSSTYESLGMTQLSNGRVIAMGTRSESICTLFGAGSSPLPDGSTDLVAGYFMAGCLARPYTGAGQQQIKELIYSNTSGSNISTILWATRNGHIAVFNIDADTRAISFKTQRWVAAASPGTLSGDVRIEKTPTTAYIIYGGGNIYAMDLTSVGATYCIGYEDCVSPTATVACNQVNNPRYSGDYSEFARRQCYYGEDALFKVSNNDFGSTSTFCLDITDTSSSTLFSVLGNDFSACTAGSIKVQ
jgi:hypothetical protein